MYAASSNVASGGDGGGRSTKKSRHAHGLRERFLALIKRRPLDETGNAEGGQFYCSVVFALVDTGEVEMQVLSPSKLIYSY